GSVGHGRPDGLRGADHHPGQCQPSRRHWPDRTALRHRICAGVFPYLLGLGGVSPGLCLPHRGPRDDSRRTGASEEPDAVSQPLRISLSISLLIGALLVVHLRSSGEAVPIRKSLDGFPDTIGEWQGREGTVLEPEIVNLLKARDYVLRRYQDRQGR